MLVLSNTSDEIDHLIKAVIITSFCCTSISFPCNKCLGEMNGLRGGTL